MPLLRNVVHRLRQQCTLSIHLGARTQGQRLGEVSNGKRIMSLGEALKQLNLEAESKRWTQRCQLAGLLLLKAQIITRSVNISWNKNPQQELLEPRRRRDIAILNDVDNTLRQYETEAQALTTRMKTPESDSSDEERGFSKAEIALRSRLRDVLSLRHRCSFLLGNVYNFSQQESIDEDFKKNMAALMDRAYEEATKIRQQLLSQLLEKANKAIVKVSVAMRDSEVSDFSMLELEEVPVFGIVGTAIKNQANVTIEVLNTNAELLWNWRGALAELLLTPLDSEEEATGNEYEAALEAQAKSEVYLEQLQLAVTDRREFLMEQRALVTQQQDGRKKARTTHRAMEAGSERLLDNEDEVAGVFGAELQQELYQELSQRRKGLRIQQSKAGRPLKRLIIDLGGTLGTNWTCACSWKY